MKRERSASSSAPRKRARVSAEMHDALALPELLRLLAYWLTDGLFFDEVGRPLPTDTNLVFWHTSIKDLNAWSAVSRAFNAAVPWASIVAKAMNKPALAKDSTLGHAQVCFLYLYIESGGGPIKQKQVLARFLPLSETQSIEETTTTFLIHGMRPLDHKPIVCTAKRAPPWVVRWGVRHEMPANTSRRELRQRWQKALISWLHLVEASRHLNARAAAATVADTDIAEE